MRIARRLFSSSAPRRRTNVITELETRGLLHDLSSKQVESHVNSPKTVYLGVDPSASSLHLGNLLALIGLLHFRLHGHSAIALIGGATGAVGDPSGRSTERNALSPEILNSNISSITKQVEGFFARAVPFARTRTSSRYRTKEEEVWATSQDRGTVKVENNLNWLGEMKLLDFLSTVGKTARMSTMLSRESVKSRLDSSSGLSFTEFSYQLLQAFDFLTLHEKHNCTIQLGGSDQLGNIMTGVEMIRKSSSPSTSTAPTPENGSGGSSESEVGTRLGNGGSDQVDPAYGVTMPLLTNSKGEKFGKSAGNAIWLNPSMTSPLDLYQFFLRTSDEDVLKYLKIFTFIRVVELEGLMEEHKARPNERVAQKILAAEATELVHGSKGLRQALSATDIYFGDLTKINLKDSIEALDGKLSFPPSSFTVNSITPSEDPDVPSLLVRLDKEDVLDSPVEKIVIKSGLLPSKTQARKSIESGTLHLNGVKLSSKDHQRFLTEKDLLQGGLVVLRSGKNNHKAVLVS